MPQDTAASSHKCSRRRRRLRRAAAGTAAGGALDLQSTNRAAAALLAAAMRRDGAPRPSDAKNRAALNQLLVRVTHQLNSRLYTKAGRFDQDPAANMPVLPLLARARELKALPKDSDTYGFLETELLRGRNAVESTLVEATREIDGYLVTAAPAATPGPPARQPRWGGAPSPRTVNPRRGVIVRSRRPGGVP